MLADGQTPLFVAAAHGHEAAVAALLHGGAPVDAALTGDGTTPLYAAAQLRHARVVELLAAAGADPHAERADGWTPLRIAAALLDEAVLKPLRDADARARRVKGGEAPAQPS